jgi:hypothetical protein
VQNTHPAYTNLHHADRSAKARQPPFSSVTYHTLHITASTSQEVVHSDTQHSTSITEPIDPCCLNNERLSCPRHSKSYEFGNLNGYKVPSKRGRTAFLWRGHSNPALCAKSARNPPRCIAPSGRDKLTTLDIMEAAALVLDCVRALTAKLQQMSLTKKDLASLASLVLQARQSLQFCFCCGCSQLVPASCLLCWCTELLITSRRPQPAMCALSARACCWMFACLPGRLPCRVWQAVACHEACGGPQSCHKARGQQSL